MEITNREGIKLGSLNSTRFMFERIVPFPSEEILINTLQKYIGKVSYFKKDANTIGFIAEEYIAEFEDGKRVPVMYHLVGFDANDYNPYKLGKTQWSCPNYKEIIDRCNYHIAVFEVFGDNLPDYKQRAELTVKVSEALLEIFDDCEAVLYEYSAKMHTREDILNMDIPEEFKQPYIIVCYNIQLKKKKKKIVL